MTEELGRVSILDPNRVGRMVMRSWRLLRKVAVRYFHRRERIEVNRGGSVSIIRDQSHLTMLGLDSPAQDSPDSTSGTSQTRRSRSTMSPVQPSLSVLRAQGAIPKRRTQAPAPRAVPEPRRRLFQKMKTSVAAAMPPLPNRLGTLTRRSSAEHHAPTPFSTALLRSLPRNRVETHLPGQSVAPTLTGHGLRSNSARRSPTSATQVQSNTSRDTTTHGRRKRKQPTGPFAGRVEKVSRVSPPRARTPGLRPATSTVPTHFAEEPSHFLWHTRDFSVAIVEANSSRRGTPCPVLVVSPPVGSLQGSTLVATLPGQVSAAEKQRVLEKTVADKMGLDRPWLDATIIRGRGVK